MQPASRVPLGAAEQPVARLPARQGRRCSCPGAARSGTCLFASCCCFALGACSTGPKADDVAATRHWFGQNTARAACLGSRLAEWFGSHTFWFESLAIMRAWRVGRTLGRECRALSSTTYMAATLAAADREQGRANYRLWAAAAAVLAASGAGVASCEEADEGAVDGMPAAIAKAMRSTVRIESWAFVSNSGFWGSGAASTAPVPTKVSSGSGVVYDAEERLILTNAHVLDSPPGLRGVATRVKVVFCGGQVREGRVVAVDRDCDIGLLRIEEPRWRLGTESERVELVEAPLGEPMVGPYAPLLPLRCVRALAQLSAACSRGSSLQQVASPLPPCVCPCREKLCPGAGRACCRAGRAPGRVARRHGGHGREPRVSGG